MIHHCSWAERAPVLNPLVHIEHKSRADLDLNFHTRTGSPLIGAKATDKSVAFDVFGTCLPVLIRCIAIYTRSLGLFGISPDIEGGDGQLAGQSLAAAKEVALICLLLIQGAPALQPRHRAETTPALNGLLTKVKADRLVELGDEVYEVLGQWPLRSGHL